MNFNESVFKAYDIRGVVGTELTTELCMAIGRAFADFLPQTGPVVVGYDMRNGSLEMAQSLRSGLVAQGRDVLDIGLVTTDMIYFATGYLKAAGGAMVTASHNPGNYDGIKLCGYQASGISLESGLEVIREAIKTDQYKTADSVGRVIEQNINQDWITHALSFVDVSLWKEYRVAVDAGNGMAGEIIPYLESRVPLTIVGMDFMLDGDFPHHAANPLILENVADEAKEIFQDKLDFGIAFDGDGDRAFLLDETGKEVTASVLGAILAEHFLELNPGAMILYNVVCSRIVADVVSKHGGVPVKTRAGHSFIKAEMKKTGAPFACEASGHFYFKDNFNADSGLIAALIAVDVLNKSGLKLSELAEKYQKYFSSGEINLEVADKEAAIDKIAAKFVDGAHDNLDGLTVNYPDWWFNVRPSNTEPFLRLNVEAISRELMERRRDELLKLLA